MKKKILAFTLALLMVLPMCVFGVSADSGTEVIDWEYSGKNSIFIGDNPQSNSAGGSGNPDSTYWTDNSSDSCLKWDKISPTSTTYKKAVALAANTSSGLINMANVNTFTVSADVTGFGESETAVDAARIVDIYDCYSDKTNYSGLRYRIEKSSHTTSSNKLTLQYMKFVNGSAEVNVTINSVDITAGQKHNFKIEVIEGKTYVYVDGVNVTTDAISTAERIQTTTHYVGMKAECTNATFENWKVYQPQDWEFTGNSSVYIGSSEPTTTTVSGKINLGNHQTDNSNGDTLQWSLNDNASDWQKNLAFAGNGAGLVKFGANEDFYISATVNTLKDNIWVKNGTSDCARVFEFYDSYISSTNYSGLRYRLASSSTQNPTLQYVIKNSSSEKTFDIYGNVSNASEVLKAGSDIKFDIYVVDGKTYVYINDVMIDISELTNSDRIINGYCGIKSEHTSVIIKNWKISDRALPKISGTPAVGETLTASWSEAPAGGTWEWVNNGVVIGKGETFKPTIVDAGMTVSARYKSANGSYYYSSAVAVAARTDTADTNVECFGMQASLDGSAVRILGAVENVEALDNVGFDVMAVVNGKAQRWLDKATETVYTSVKVSDATYTDAEGRYIFVYEINNIPSNLNLIEIKFTVTPFSTASEAKNYGETQTFDITPDISKHVDKLSADRKTEILNAADVTVPTGAKAYYFSNNGSDSNSGTKEAPFATLDKLRTLTLSEGDYVLFERGSVWRDVRITAVSGVTYAAYGEGDKPTFYGSPENGDYKNKWEKVGETNIYKYTGTSMPDVGEIFLYNDGVETYAYKHIPSYVSGQWVTRKTTDDVFDYTTYLGNLDFVYLTEDNTKTDGGTLYLRCEAGNPADVYARIEFNRKGNIIDVSTASKVLIDNLCIMYTGSHAISVESSNNITVQNCVIGNIGGSIQGYKDDGSAIRYGNGVQLYGAGDGFNVINNYIYNCYDAGITHQQNTEESNIIQQNIKYENNLVEDCIYNIEYFMYSEGGEMKNVTINNNILRRSGSGFGITRPYQYCDALIKGIAQKDTHNKQTDFKITNNIFDRGCTALVWTTVGNGELSAPEFEGNTYIQGLTNNVATLGVYSNQNYYKNNRTNEADILQALGDKTGKVYTVATIDKDAWYSYPSIDN